MSFSITDIRSVLSSQNPTTIEVLYNQLSRSFLDCFGDVDNEVLSISEALRLLRLWTPNDVDSERKLFIKNLSKDGSVHLTRLFSYFKRTGSINSSMLIPLYYDLQRVLKGKADHVNNDILLAKPCISDTNNVETSCSNPIEHVVLIRVKDEVDDEAKTHLCRVLGLLSVVPGVVNVKAGVTSLDLFEGMVDRSNNYGLILKVQLVDGEALKLYGPHPLHVHIRDHCIRTISSGPADAVDFIDQSSTNE